MAGAQRGWPQFMLRVSPEMKVWIEDQSERSFSSQNSEILRCIQERMDRTAALEARRKPAAREGIRPTSPAAVRSKGAQQGAPHNQPGKDMPR
jgi:hypothetical protein